MENKIIAKSILFSWVQLANQHGIDTTLILEKLELKQDEEVIPFEKFAFFGDWLLQKTIDKQIGIRLGTRANLAVLGIVGQLIQASSTIREALTKAAHYFNLISNVLQLHFEVEGSKVILSFKIDEPTYKKYPFVCEQILITSMIFTMKEVHLLTLQQAHPTEVKTSLLNEGLAEFATVFNCPIKWNESQNSLCFEAKILEEKILYTDYELFLKLEQLACKRLTKQVQQLSSFSDHVKTIVYSMLDPNFPSLKAIAYQLNMSERSLQRKLKAEQTSYSVLLTEIKKSIATECLQQNLSIKETAYLLGYSEPSAFIHAFIEWFGKSPNQYKNQLKVV